MNIFKKATKKKAKLRLALAGPSGSGKTYTSLAVATHLAKKIAVIDTEHGSASKYAGIFDFDVLELPPPYKPERYVQAVKSAADEGYGLCIIDSLSHAWSGEGGLLEIVNEITRRSKSGNSYVAWRDATPQQNKLIESLIGTPLHIIATMRSKQDYVIEKDEKGKVQVKKLGLAPIQREGMEFEFDLFGEMDVDNVLCVRKSRCPELQNAVMTKPGKDLANALKKWLSDGEPVKDSPKPQPEEKPTNGLSQSIDKVKTAFSKWNVTLDDLESKIKKPVEEWTKLDLVSLRSLYTSINDKKTTIDKEFSR